MYENNLLEGKTRRNSGRRLKKKKNKK